MLQTDSVKLRQHYMNSTTFYIDLLCLLPLDFLYLSLEFQSMLRVCRLVKIYRFWEFLDRCILSPFSWLPIHTPLKKKEFCEQIQKRGGGCHIFHTYSIIDMEEKKKKSDEVLTRTERHTNYPNLFRMFSLVFLLYSLLLLFLLLSLVWL